MDDTKCDNYRLKSNLDEQIHQLRVVYLCSEITFQDFEHTWLQDETVVDRDELHIVISIPLDIHKSKRELLERFLKEKMKEEWAEVYW